MTTTDTYQIFRDGAHGDKAHLSTDGQHAVCGVRVNTPAFGIDHPATAEAFVEYVANRCADCLRTARIVAESRRVLAVMEQHGGAFLSTNAAAARAGGRIGVEGIKRACQKGAIAGAVKVGRDWLIPVDGLQDYLAHRPKRGPKQKPPD